MQVPAWLFQLGLWAAVSAVGLVALYLLTILGYEWFKKQLW